jgi:hypothetical protein
MRELRGQRYHLIGEKKYATHRKSPIGKGNAE